MKEGGQQKAVKADENRSDRREWWGWGRDRRIEGCGAGARRDGLGEEWARRVGWWTGEG